MATLCVCTLRKRSASSQEAIDTLSILWLFLCVRAQTFLANVLRTQSSEIAFTKCIRRSCGGGGEDILFLYDYFFVSNVCAHVSGRQCTGRTRSISIKRRALRFAVQARVWHDSMEMLLIPTRSPVIQHTHKISKKMTQLCPQPRRTVSTISPGPGALIMCCVHDDRSIGHRMTNYQ